MKAINLRTEYLINPIGIDILNPRLSWNCDGDIRQTAFQIIAYLDNKIILDTQKVLSNSMFFVFPYKLKSKDYVIWKIRLWNELDEVGNFSDSAYFEMGLLNKNDFVAKWITGNYLVNKNKRYPVDCFKKEFNITKVSNARLYITACGLYEAKINNKRVGNIVLSPGHTDYTKRIQLQTYDVTDLLQDGKNTITIELADGFYRGSCGAWGRRNQYGKVTKLWAQLEVGNQIIVTDNSWLWSNDGEIVFADNKDGEIVNANNSPSYSSFAKLCKCNIIPTSSNNVNICEHERLKVKNIIKTPKGKLVLDFGQNIAGYISFKIEGKRNQKIKLRFGEMIDKDGEFTQKNIQCISKHKITPLQQVEYIFKDGLNEYKTRFAIFGFQYVEVETDCNFSGKDFEAIAVYSSLEDTLLFDSSNELLNKFVESTRWSAKNNHADVPTDCPTRERHGWTGDAQIFCKTASYLFNYEPFARKYINDMNDGQRKNGVFRQISPKGGIDFYMNSMDGSAGWSDAGVFIPYRIYKQYGDKKILSDNFSYMEKYVNYKIKTLGKHYLTSASTHLKHKYRKYISNYGQSYGEWAEPTDVNAFKISDFICPHPEETTAYIVYLLEIFSKICDVLGKDNKKYLLLAQKVKEGYQNLVETKKSTLDTNRQAKLVRPLYFNLLNDKQIEFAKQRLIQALDEYSWRVGTGFLSTPFILYVLEDIDLSYAYKLLENEEMPGWLYMSKMNANTIWESWEGTSSQKGIASLNHYSKGAVLEWIFSRMCGINVVKENEFLICPQVGGNFTYAKCEYLSIYGKVKSEWKVQNKKTEYIIEIPSNTKATIIINNQAKIVEAGIYKFCS